MEPFQQNNNLHRTVANGGGWYQARRRPRAEVDAFERQRQADMRAQFEREEAERLQQQQADDAFWNAPVPGGRPPTEE